VHDGTHGVNVNPEAKPRYQVRMPTAGDMRAQFECLADRGDVNFALEADVAKAHRRCLGREADWGLQCWRLSKGRTWVNRVGTVGVSSAGYHWSRLAGGIARLVWSLSEWNHWIFQLIYADDLR
jgi:hypothetical protein